MKELKSERIETQGVLEAIELCFREGWTPGLPVVPPTEARVAEFLSYANLEPDQVLGEIPERAVAITAEAVAVNAVMAGCLPEYMPVLVAAVEAVTHPDMHINILASLASPWPLLIVSGPIVKQLGMHTGIHTFSSGNRANTTIGYALSLLLWNCADARPGGIARGTAGHPGRYTFCIAENEDTPWEPLRVSEGFERSVSTVTAVMTTLGMQHARIASRDAEDVAKQLAYLITSMSFYRGCHLVVMPPHYVKLFSEQGWTKDRVRDYVKEHARRSVADVKRIGRWGWWGGVADKPVEVEPEDETRFVYLFGDQPSGQRS